MTGNHNSHSQQSSVSCEGESEEGMIKSRKRRRESESDQQVNGFAKLDERYRKILDPSSDLSSMGEEEDNENDEGDNKSEEIVRPRRSIVKVKKVHRDPKLAKIEMERNLKGVVSADESQDEFDDHDNDDDYKPQEMEREMDSRCKIPTEDNVDSDLDYDTSLPVKTSGKSTDSARKNKDKNRKLTKTAGTRLEVTFQNHSSASTAGAEKVEFQKDVKVEEKKEPRLDTPVYAPKVVTTAMQSKSAAWAKFSQRPSGGVNVKASVLGKKGQSTPASSLIDNKNGTNMKADTDRSPNKVPRKTVETAQKSRFEWQIEMEKQQKENEERKRIQEEQRRKREEDRLKELTKLREQDIARRMNEIEKYTRLDILSQSRVMYEFERSLRHDPHPFSVNRPDRETMLKLRETIMQDGIGKTPNEEK